MTEESGKENRDRKVIPYDQAFGAQNANLTYTEPEEGDAVQSDEEDANAFLNTSYQAGLLRNVDSEETDTEEEVGSPLGAAEPIGRNDRDPEDIRSERDDIESAQEIAEPVPRENEENRKAEENNVKENGGNGLGIAGLILSLASIFILPAILAPAGIIVGYIAFRQGSRTTGIWAMVIGAFALLMALLVLPAYFR